MTTSHTTGTHDTRAYSWVTRFFVALLAIILLAPPALAELDSKGTDFWLAFPENYDQTPELRLFLAGDTGATGRVSVPGIGFQAAFATSPGQITTVSLPAGAQLTTADGVQPRGIRVEATADVSVYGLNRIQYTTDAYLGLPTDVLGSEYIVMSHPGLSGYGSELAVVAPHDGTTVTIVPSVSTGARQAGEPFTVSLRAGDAYQLRASGGQDLSGTFIAANKPVAAFGAARCANVPVGYPYCDHLVEQLTPPNTWGTNFAAMPLATRARGDTFRFLAASDGTDVVVNGQRVATLSRGQLHQSVLEGPSHVVATKPILVAQFSNGQNYDGVVSDPFMMLVPPYEQFLNRYTISTPASGFAGHYVNIVAPAAAVGKVQVDGAAVPADRFVPIGASGFSGAQVPIATGAHTLTGPTRFGAFVYGFGSYDSYGYPAGTSLRRLNPLWSGFGWRRSAGWANDPVNTGSGNFVYGATDLEFGSVWGLDLDRTYNGLDDVADTPLGRGWSLSAQKWVTEDVDGTVWLHESDGRVVAFTPEGGGYTRPEEVFGAMRRDDDSSLSIAYFDGSVDDFGANGRLTERRRWDGQRVSFAYDEAGKLNRLTHSSAKSLLFAHHASGRLATAEADDGRKVSYAYDADGDLASVTDPAGGVTRYETDGHGLITRVVDPAGRLVVANTYDGLRRVATQQFPAGGTAQFSYDLASRVTTVTDGSTGEVTRFGHDWDGRLVEVVDAAGAVLTKSYDAPGNLVSVTDRRSATLHTRYDANGNVVGTTDPLGARMSRVYDNQHRLVSETDADGKTTRYAYVGGNRIPTTITDANGAATLAEVSDGLVTSLTDADGVKHSFGYDAARNLVSVTDALGSTARLGYDAPGRPTSMSAPSGATTRVSYDALGRVLSETDAAGAVTRYRYDASGKLVSHADPTGATTSYAYDAGGNVAEARDANGAATTYAYNANGEVTSVTKPGGATTSYRYGPLGRLEAVTDPGGAVTRFGYDANGNVVETTDASGGVTKAAYDLKGRLVGETDALGNATRLSYDALDRLVFETDPAGAVTAHAYDALGRPVSTTDARGAVTRRAYTPAGRLASETDAAGAVTRYGYDRAGRVSSVTDPLGGVAVLAHDVDGQLVSQRSPAGLLTSFAYDPVGRLVEVTEPGGGATARTFTSRGELATETDPTGATRSFAYDPVGDVIAAVDANGGRTTYGYDARGNRVSRTDAAGGLQTWSYDFADRLIASTDPLKRTTVYEYDGLGRLVRSADPSGRSQSLSYDAAGRLIGRSFADGSRVTYAYDAAGRRTQMIDGEGATTYAYDAVGNLTELLRPDGKRLAYGYDLARRRTGVAYPDGGVATSTYDANGRVASVAHPTLGTTTQSWDRDGRLVGEALPGGPTRSFSYDAAGRLASFAQRLSGADRATTLGRDRAGRIVSETTAGVTTSYTYDRAGQLLGASGGGFTATYAYDAIGRRTTASTNGVPVRYVHDAAGQLVSEQVDGSTRTYTYDEAGRRTSASDATTKTNYRYGPQGQLASVESTTGTRTTMEQRSYNGDGALRRITRTEPTGTTTANELTWDAGAVPEVLTLESGGVATNFVYGARRIGAVTGGATPAVFAVDAHGSTIATAATAAFAVAGRYDPYGNPMTTAACSPRPVHPLDPNHCAGDAKGGTPPNVGSGKGRTRAFVPFAGESPSSTSTPRLGFGYRGELHVDDLVHLRARDYDASTGLFTTVDPLPGVVGEVTVANPYPYAANDPLNQVDPLGLTPLRDRDMRLVLPADPVGGTNEFAGDRISSRCSWCRTALKGAAIVAGVAGAIACGATVVCGIAVGVAAGAAFYAAGNAWTKNWSWRGLAVEGAIGGVLGGAAGRVASLGKGIISRGLRLFGGGGNKAPRSVTGVADDLGALCRTNSFIPATLVLMADGTIKPIADVEVGDMVLASDPETGERGPRRVTDTIVGDGIKELVDVEIDGHLITATDRHPFWVDDEGRWVDAEDLEAGDVLLLAGRQTVTIDSVRERTEVRRVHNLTVDGIHTYFVLAGDAAVLVHNCGMARPGDLLRTEALSGRSSSRTVTEIAESMRVNGWVGDPIETFVINGERYVINGHHRVAAAMRAGIDVQYRTLSIGELQAYGYRSADDVISAWASRGPDRLRR